MQRERKTMGEKLKIVKEALGSGNCAEVARKYNLKAKVVQDWVRQYHLKKELWENVDSEAKQVNLDPQETSDVDKKTYWKERTRSRNLEKQLAEAEFKNKVLERLLKKSVVTLAQKIEEAKYWLSRGHAKGKVLRVLNVSATTFWRHMKADSQSFKESWQRKPRPGRKPLDFVRNMDNEKVNINKVKTFVVNYLEKRKLCQYGYRKLAKVLLNEYKLVINHKRMYKLCKEMKILKNRRKKQRSGISRCIYRQIRKPNALWQMDIKVDLYKRNDGLTGQLYVLNVIDVYTRRLVVAKAFRSCRADDVVKALVPELMKLDQNIRHDLVIRTDNGTQFTSKIFRAACQHYNINHEVIPPRNPNQNAYVEGYHSVFEEEFIRPFEIRDWSTFVSDLSDYVEWYNNERLHGSLNYLSPLEFEKTLKQEINLLDHNPLCHCF